MLLYLIITLTLVHPSLAATSREIAEAKKSIEALISPLIPGKSKQKPRALKNFSVDDCEKQKINWMNVLLMKEEATLAFRFKKGCDIQGVIKPKILQQFPAKLDLRNLESYSQIASQNKITANLLESKPVLNLEMLSGTLTGKKGKVKFEADYQVQVNPFSQSKLLEKNLGGELRITEIYGKKVSIKEKIIVE